MERAQKTSVIESLCGQFEKAKAAYLVDFSGMNVEQVTALRKKLSLAKSEMRVVRNTLAVQALKKFPTKTEAIKKHLKGTNAFVFAYEDISESAKILRDYSKDVENLKIKSGLLEDTELSQSQIIELSKLPSKEVLRAQFLGMLMGPAQNFVRVLSAVPSGFARVLNQYKETKEKA